MSENIDLVAEVFYIMKDYIQSYDKEEVATTVVTLLKDHGIKDDTILSALGNDPDVSNFLGVEAEYDEDEEYIDDDDDDWG